MGQILVLRALGLGDFLTALPALRGLRRCADGRELVLATHGNVSPLVAWSGLVEDQIIVTDLDHAGVFRPELAVNLHGRGPQSHRWLLRTLPRALVAFANPEVDAPGPAWRRDEHEVQRWCRLLRWANVPCDPAELQLDPPPDPLGRDADRVVVHVGAAAPARRWPAERWAAVVAWLRGRGLHPVLTGSASERGIAAVVAARSGVPAEDVVAGETDVVQLAGVVAGARLVLAGDTGVGHLATALGRPSVLLFGPTSPEHWGPPADRPEHTVLWAGAPGDPHAEAPSPGLLAIGVDDVREATQRQLDAATDVSLRSLAG